MIAAGRKRKSGIPVMAEMERGPHFRQSFHFTLPSGGRDERQA
ncbi:MAG: hypothetical protein ACE15C_07830 [Phycisphaerae bacterium]